MNELKIYNELKQNLSAIAFLKDVSNQIKIKEIKDDNLFSENLKNVMVKIILFSGIKEKVDDLYKADIKNMMLNHYKHFSLNEITYAFELERYGKLGDKTQHFQLFNADYVSTVLKKYETWKAVTRKQNNINTLKIENSNEMTPEEIEFSMIEGCDRIFREYKLNHRIEGVYVHIYDHLFKKGLLPRDKFYKDMIFAKAQVIAISEVKANARENNEPKKTMERAIKEIEDKVNLTPIAIAKKLALEDYFQKLIKNNENLNDKI